MAIERVKDFFRKYGIEDRIQEFDVSSATVELAAAPLRASEDSEDTFLFGGWTCSTCCDSGGCED